MKFFLRADNRCPDSKFGHCQLCASYIKWSLQRCASHIVDWKVSFSAEVCSPCYILPHPKWKTLLWVAILLSDSFTAIHNYSKHAWMIRELYRTLPNPLSIPISNTSVPRWYGSWMELCQIHRIPIVRGQRSRGIGMRVSHITPILDPMGYLWISAKYVAFP